jgi:hypothetical protein
VTGSCSCPLLLPPELVVGVGIEPTFRAFQARANPCQLSDPFWGSWQDSNPQLRRSKRRTLPVELQEQRSRMERAVRLELTNTGFAIQRLGRLATRATWNGRRDSNSRVEFGRLACFQLHHFRRLGRRVMGEAPAPSSWGEEIVD